MAIGVNCQVGKVETPTMQFTNNTGTRITVWVYCRSHRGWANDQRPLVVRAGATATLKLHEGYFQVVARNDYGQEDRNNRLLSAKELDRMNFAGIYSGRPGERPVPKFRITEHRDDDDDDK
jgi:hypothetical protein